TALTDMISVQYLMARDGELPTFLTSLNRFGVPWIPAIIASAVPVIVLLVSHDLDSLAALYAIGVIGAVAINTTLVATHPRLPRRSPPSTRHPRRLLHPRNQPLLQVQPRRTPHHRLRPRRPPHLLPLPRPRPLPRRPHPPRLRHRPRLHNPHRRNRRPPRL